MRGHAQRCRSTSLAVETRRHELASIDTPSQGDLKVLAGVRHYAEHQWTRELGWVMMNEVTVHRVQTSCWS